MNDLVHADVPITLDAILRDTRAIGFTMASEPKTGSLLRALAASKPAGRFLELGTGTGVGTAWLLAGMDAGARLESVDSDGTVLEVAKRHLAHDPRVRPPPPGAETSAVVKAFRRAPGGAVRGQDPPPANFPTYSESADCNLPSAIS